MVSHFSKRNNLSVLFIIALIILVVLTGCENFSLYDKLGMDFLSSGGFMLIPLSPTVAVGNSLTFSVVGGTSPFVYSVTGSGTIDTDTGFYTAPPVQGTDVVQVVDAAGLIRSVSVLVVNEVDLQIFPPMLTISTNDVFYFTTIGGTPPYEYEVTSGGGTINPGTGEFHAPSGASTTEVRVTDDAGTSVNSSVTIREGLVIVPLLASVPANNNIAFTASGGDSPYTYTMKSGFGTVTAGGFYTAPVSAGTDEVRVTDDDGYSSIATITVTPPQPLNIVPSSVIVLTGGIFTFSATGGTPLYTFIKLSGGGAITAAGVYTAPGTPGKAYLRVTDDSPTPLTADGEVIIVSFGPLAITPGVVTVEQGKSYTFSASGGIPPYAYSVTSGTGIIIGSPGVYTAPLTLGAETVRVTDADLDTFDATVNIAPAAPSNLFAISPVNGEILLTWDDNSTGEGGFVVQRRNSSEIFADLVSLPAGTESYTDTGLNPTTAFNYRVRAYFGVMVSGYSNEYFTVPKP